MRRAVGAAAVVLAVALLLIGCSGSGSGGAGRGPLRIGVMLPITGPDARGYREPLDWAVENVNRAGGVAGRKLAARLRRPRQAARSTPRPAGSPRDPSIVAVIGPNSSDRFFAAAPALIEAKKTIVTPTATSGDIFRAFSSSGFVWRTVQSDIAQVRTALTLLARDGARRPAVIAGVDHYGETFYDWFGFYANELGIEPAALVRYDQAHQDCTPYVDQALATQPRRGAGRGQGRGQRRVHRPRLAGQGLARTPAVHRRGRGAGAAPGAGPRRPGAGGPRPRRRPGCRVRRTRSDAKFGHAAGRRGRTVVRRGRAARLRAAALRRPRRRGR